MINFSLDFYFSVLVRKNQFLPLRILHFGWFCGRWHGNVINKSQFLSFDLSVKWGIWVRLGNWNAKVGSQETPGVTGKFGLGMQNEAGQKLIVLPRKCTGHSKHPLPTTQEKTLHMVITRWSTPKSGWLYSLQPKMEKQTRPGADCGSDHELLIVKLRLKLKKVGQTWIV